MTLPPTCNSFARVAQHVIADAWQRIGREVAALTARLPALEAAVAEAEKLVASGKAAIAANKTLRPTFFADLPDFYESQRRTVALSAARDRLGTVRTRLLELESERAEITRLAQPKSPEVRAPIA